MLKRNPFFKLIRFLITDEDDQWDIGILFWITGVALFMYRSWMLPTFDPQNFGIGLTGVLGAGSVLQWIRQQGKEKTSDTSVDAPK